VRTGSLAGLLLAALAFASNCILPALIKALQNARKITNKDNLRSSKHSGNTEIPSATIALTWMFAHAYFTVAMLLTFLVTSRMGRMILVTSIGISWAITLWAPYCLLGIILTRCRHLPMEESELGFQNTPEAGAVMGFHNTAISAPQILSALICSATFAVFDGPGGGVVWPMRIGGCWTIVATYLAWKLADELELE